MRLRALVAVTAVCTLAFGVPPLAARQLEAEQTDAEVFLEVGATPRQIAAVRRALDRDRAVEALSFVDEDAAYQELSRLFAANRDLVESVEASSLPASFRVDLRATAEFDQWSRRVERLAGVDAVAKPSGVSAPQFIEIVNVCAERRYRLEAFMDVRATSEQIAAVRQVLEQNAAVRNVHYLDRQDALREFKRVFHDEPDLIRNVNVSDLPVSFRFGVDGDGDVEATVVAQLKALAGVDEVAAPSGVCDELAAAGLLPGWRASTSG